MTISSDDKQYRVSKNNRIAMPPGLSGKYYLRRICADGAVTFLPITPPKTAEELYKERQAAELKTNSG